MRKSTLGLLLLSFIISFSSCDSDSDSGIIRLEVDSPESFADLQILQYQVPGWDQLELKQKERHHG